MHRHQHTTRLLIIDDDLLVRTLAAEALQSAGFDVMQAADGRTGLTLLEQHHPALVLLDVMMPGMNGYEVCQRIRANPDWYHTRVMMLTAKGREVDAQKGMAAGADAYVTKPFSTRDLLAQVRRILDQAR